MREFWRVLASVGMMAALSWSLVAGEDPKQDEAAAPAEQQQQNAGDIPTGNDQAFPAPEHAPGGEHAENLGHALPYWSVAPFAILLGCIAIFPLANPHWWEHNSNKAIIAAALAIPTAAYLAMSFGAEGLHKLEHAGLEYLSFIVLLGSLFVISGGVYIRGAFAGTALVNTIFLAIGALLASFIGTTGASMVLLRPLLRANAGRSNVAHIVVFFIFAVSNCGGLLTPLGDPPLFMGFLAGIKFTWTLQLWPQWLTVNGLILAVFLLWDTLAASTEGKDDAPAPAGTETFGIEGASNLAFLATIVVIIYISGNGIGNNGKPWEWYVRDPLMLAISVLAFLTTSKTIRDKNRFTFGPILEVAILFAGIFVTMIPALVILNANGAQLGVTEPWQFFWATGTLSSFLDNAPTYLAFSAAACGLENIPLTGPYLQNYLAAGGERAEAIMMAISCGAVFMGANTYIGNGPNFMVKAIAEENNVRMPSFFGYMAYSIGILIPIFILVTFAFFK